LTEKKNENVKIKNNEPPTFVLQLCWLNYKSSSFVMLPAAFPQTFIIQHLYITSSIVFQWDSLIGVITNLFINHKGQNWHQWLATVCIICTKAMVASL